MIADAPYIDYFENYPIANVRIIDNNEKQDPKGNTISFLNIMEIHSPTPTEKIINDEQKQYERISEIQKISSFINDYPAIFADSSEQFIVSAFEKMRNGLINLSLDILLTDISQEDECMFMYGQKNDIKFFFNLFFNKNDVETLVNISTPNNKYIIEDNIENSIQRISKIFRTK